jgi:hypothetical protein
MFRRRRAQYVPFTPPRGGLLRRRNQVQPAPLVVMTGREAARYARRTPQAVPAGASPQPVQGRFLGETLTPAGGFRFRLHLVPFGFLAFLIVAGMVVSRLPLLAAGVAGLAAAALAAGATRHLSRFARNWSAAASAVTAAWFPAAAAAGFGRPVPALLAVVWVACTVPWVRHYAWRPGEEPAPVKAGHIEHWAATLGAKGRLAGSWLTAPEPIEGGTTYTLMLRAGEQDTSDVFAMAKRIASWADKPPTEAYPERYPDGRESRTKLTILDRNTLTGVRYWDGTTIDPATGLAEFADFADGRPAHFRFWSPRNGTKQSIVVGVTGSGKSGLLHLLASIAVTSPVPVVPIILDPQQGQSLSDWRGQVRYAEGPDECMAYLRAYEAGMTARSLHLAHRPWTGDDGYERPGMDFFDPVLAGMPVVFLIFDEAHLLLNDKQYGDETRAILANLAKLNRKAGGHLMLASHTLLLEEVGSHTLRSMLVGGNVICLRTGEKMSGGIVGLEADPHLLPKYFADGSETCGLGYTMGPDARPDAPARSRLVDNPRRVAVESSIAEMDPVFGDAFRASLAAQEDTMRRGSRKLAIASGARSAGVPAAEVPEDDCEPGTTAADAVLAVLAGGEMATGDIIQAAGARRIERGAAKPYSIRAVSTALAALTRDGRIVKLGDRGPYALAETPGRPDGETEAA